MCSPTTILSQHLQTMLMIRMNLLMVTPHHMTTAMNRHTVIDISFLH